MGELIKMENKLTKKEKDWILEQIKINLDSYRREANIRGLTFKGSFSEDLPKKEREIMKSIYKKIKEDLK